jgi:hypothetical protein
MFSGRLISAAAAAAGLLVDWTGEGVEVWQERLAAASGAATVESVLRKNGVKVST